MSISNWNDYGYGIRTDNLQIKSEESLGELVSMAPKLKAEMDAYFEEQEISELTMEDYLGYDTEYDYQLASLMRLVAIFEGYGAAVRIIFLETGWEEGMHRNSNRHRKVPESVIRKMLNQIVPAERFEAQKVEWYCV